MPQLAADRVAAVRAFNRFYTRVIGILDESLLDSPYSLTEGRVIFEIAQRPDVEAAELRRVLDLDAGYLSRIIARLERDGLVTRERVSTDARRQVIRLTDRGGAEFAKLDARSAEEIERVLAPLAETEQRRLLGAMQAILEVLAAQKPLHIRPPDPLPSKPRQPLQIRPPQPGDFGWVVHRHGLLYAEQYGWDETFEALVARIVADFIADRDPVREAAWIAELDGSPAGSVFCTKRDSSTAQLRLLLVEPSARGRGAGTRLVDQCLDFARAAGYERIMLWTNDVLEEARRIYERAGFALVDEEPHHSFGRDLVGQNWMRTL